MSDQEQQPEVQLPGYELIEKIGSGGYGEVWSAIAPGGLRKAIKFVFGNQFDKRATSELHALEKIKSVRHPFLLSLERIEIVDGRLVVVSELADASLRDRFRECVQQGLPGIPREELLGYLADTADALDFISERHDLAHLDIKPENLLLVAGHVKVADFGLVKSLSNQTQASLVGGMTPTYAAPEVFRGSPSRRSDQYSLAILYQEMLTGEVPFAGVNAAELTLQHMQEDPDLGRLPDGDRFPISRALSKDDANRFETARSLVASLRQAAASGASFGPAETTQSHSKGADWKPPVPSKPSRHSVTEVFEAPIGSEAAAGRSNSLVVFPTDLEEPNPHEQSLPELSDEAFSASPAVFIGVGGTGARILRALRSQMREHLGADGPLDAAPMLLFDTDTQTLSAATRGSDRGLGIEAAETVALPLRRPQEYRSKADLLLRWLGRRWLYNIPRSLRTEGIRPLGRLALVDHARQAFQRLRGALLSAVSEESRAASTEAVGLPFHGPGVRVYVVGSASGGAGSGMSIDLAYAARSILSRLGDTDARLIGLMTHSTSRDATRSELARVNSYAWLSEFDAFRNAAAGYPGDESVGLPAHEPGVAAFDDAYYVPLGEQIDTPAFESSADAVAEYLYADAFTPGQRLLDACREASKGESGGVLRSFAVRHRDGQADGSLGPIEQGAALRMIDRWLGGEPDEAPGADTQSTDQVVHGAVAFLGRTQLDSSTIASNCRSLLEASLGGDATAYVDARFGGRSGNIGEDIARIDESFGSPPADGLPDKVDGRDIEDTVAPITQKLTEESIAWVLSRVNDPQERLEGATRAAMWLADYLNAVDSDLKKVGSSLVVAWKAWGDKSHLTAADEPGNDARLKLFRLRLDQAAIVAARRIVENLQKRLGTLPDEVATLRETAVRVKNRLEEASLGAPLDAEVDRASVAIEQRLQADYLGPLGGLLGALSGQSTVAEIAATIAHAAKMVARDTAPTSRAAADAALLAGFADAPIDNCGGEYRRLTLEQTSADAASGEEAELLLVTEMAGVSLPHLAANLIGGRRDYAAFAERVRTRRDIPWTDPVMGAKGAEPDSATVAPVFEMAPALPTATSVI